MCYKVGNRSYREMTKGYVHLSQEVVPCLLRREKIISVFIYWVIVNILKRISLQTEKSPGSGLGEWWGWVEGRGPGEPQMVAALEMGEPKASNTWSSAGRLPAGHWSPKRLETEPLLDLGSRQSAREGIPEIPEGLGAQLAQFKEKSVKKCWGQFSWIFIKCNKWKSSLRAQSWERVQKPVTNTSCTLLIKKWPWTFNLVIILLHNLSSWIIYWL